MGDIVKPAVNDGELVNKPKQPKADKKGRNMLND